MNQRKDKLLIVGAFDFKGMDTGGQPVKTRELYYALQQYYGKEKVHYCETVGWQKKPLRILFSLMKEMRECGTVIMLPAQRGLRIFSRLLLVLNINKCNLIYDVIGGWLPDVLVNENSIKRNIMKFSQIWVETSSMKESLEHIGLTNVVQVRNFKSLDTLSLSDLRYDFEYPLKVCMFSRVRPEKGVEDAIHTLSRINKEFGRKIYEIDIYGLVEEEYKDRFNEIVCNNSSFVKYKGIASPNDSVKIIRQYYALLFPTRFYTEGVPGTLIDSYCAGVPVISSRWVNSKDVFIEGITGWGFDFGDVEQFYIVLKRAAEYRNDFLKMKLTTLEEGKKYLPDSVVEDIVHLVGESL